MYVYTSVALPFTSIQCPTLYHKLCECACILFVMMTKLCYTFISLSVSLALISIHSENSCNDYTLAR